LTKLARLDLSMNNITVIGIKELVSYFKRLGVLEFLDISNNMIGDDGIKILADNLTHVPKLNYLDLSKNKIGDNGIISLANNLKHVLNLGNLYLDSNKISNKGALALINQLNITKIYILGLNNNQIKDVDKIKKLITNFDGTINFNVTLTDQIIQTHICIPNVRGEYDTMDCEGEEY